MDQTLGLRDARVDFAGYHVVGLAHCGHCSPDQRYASGFRERSEMGAVVVEGGSVFVVRSSEHSDTSYKAFSFLVFTYI